VARLVVHVETVDHVLGGLVAGVELDRGVHVPLDHLAVEEQRGVGVAATVEGRVQGAQANSTSATMALSSSGSLPSNQSSTLASSITVAVGESLPAQMKYLPSGLAFTPCGFLGTLT
jgi:hypothetical protein